MRWLLLAAAAAVSGCGGGKCANQHAGAWVGVTLHDNLLLTPDCDYEYQGADGCRSSGTYAAPLGNSGTVLVTIASATPGRCLGVGSYTCGYSAPSAAALAIDCGAGEQRYSR